MWVVMTGEVLRWVLVLVPVLVLVLVLLQQPGDVCAPAHPHTPYSRKCP
jgi:hypothetical protein